MCGLSLAWVTSENSTSTSNADSSWLTVAGPYPMLPRLSAPVSGVDCPCPWFHANSLLASLLSSRQLPSLLGRVVNARLLSSANGPLPGHVVNSHSRPPHHFQIRRDFRSKNPLSGFAPKQTIESSALAAQPHSATGRHHKVLWTTRVYTKETPIPDWLCQFSGDLTKPLHRTI